MKMAADVTMSNFLLLSISSEIAFCMDWESLYPIFPSAPTMMSLYQANLNGMPR